MTDEDEITMADKRKVLKEAAPTAPNTMFGHAMAFSGAEEGKAAALLVGSAPGVAVPRMSGASPWASPDPVGDEPPLGVDITSLPALGGKGGGHET